MATAAQSAPASAGEVPEKHVLRPGAYENVASMIVALLVLVGAAVVVLLALWLTLRAIDTPRLAPVAFSDRRAPPSVGDRFIVAGFGVGVQGDRSTAGKLRAATLVVTDRPSSQLLSLVDPRRLGETGGLGVCNGDSGGPALDERDHSLFGIVSWTSRTDGEPVCGFVSGIIPLVRYRHWISDTAAKLGSPLEP